MLTSIDFQTQITIGTVVSWELAFGFNGIILFIITIVIEIKLTIYKFSEIEYLSLDRSFTDHNIT